MLTIEQIEDWRKRFIAEFVTPYDDDQADIRDSNERDINAICDMALERARAAHGPAEPVAMPTSSAPQQAQDSERGLYNKYRVERLNDPIEKHKECRYYVLDLIHDKFSVPALLAYADVCKVEFPMLAADIYEIVGKRPEPAAVAELPEVTYVIHADQPGYSGKQPFVPITDFRRLRTAAEQAIARAERAEQQAAGLREWLDNNTTFFDVDADWPVEGHNIPALAQISNRIWYHATDDTNSYPFSAVIDAARAKDSDEDR